MNLNKPRRYLESKKYLSRMKNIPESYLTFPEKQKKSKYLANLLIKHKPELFRFIHPELQQDIDFIKVIIKTNPIVFRYFPQKLKQQEDILNYFVTMDFFRLTHIVEKHRFEMFKRLTKSADFSMDSNINMFEYFFGKHFIFSKKTTLSVLAKTKQFSLPMQKAFYQAIPENWKEQVGFIKSLLKMNYQYYPYIKPKYKYDIDIVIQVHQDSYGAAFKWFPDDLRSDTFFITQMNKIRPISIDYITGKAKELLNNNAKIEELEQIMMYQEINEKISNSNSNVKKRKI